MSQVTVIEIETRVKDETASGVASAQKNLSKLEQSFLKMQSAFTALSKGSFVEVVATLEDQVSPLLDGISSLGEGLSGTAYQVTLDCLDLVTSPLSGLQESLSSPFTAWVDLAAVGEVVPEISGVASGSGASSGSGTSSVANVSNWSNLPNISGSSGAGETSTVLSQGGSGNSGVGGTSLDVMSESTWRESVHSVVETLQQGVTSSLSQMWSNLSTASTSSEKEVGMATGTIGMVIPSASESVTGNLGSWSSSSLNAETSVQSSSLEQFSEVVSGFASLVTEKTEELRSVSGGSDGSGSVSQSWLQNTSQNSQIENSGWSEGFSNWNQIFSLDSVAGALLGQQANSEQSGESGISGVSGISGEVSGGISSLHQDSDIALNVLNASEGISALFSETLPVKLEEFCTHLEESVSSSLVLAREPVSALFQGFFSESIPSVMETFFSQQVTALEEVTSLASESIREGMGGFWQEELPSLFDGFWEGCTEQLTQGEGLALEAVTEGVHLFWGEGVTSVFDDFWSSTQDSLLEGQAVALEQVYEGVEGFFGETIPFSLEELWTKSSEKIAETSLVTQTVINLGIGTFFGETIPSSVQYIWDGATSTLEGAKVASLASVSGGISGFFASATSSINCFFATAQSKISAALSQASASVSGLSVSAGSGSVTAVSAYANGGILSSPHVGLVAEDGPEAIIPLSGKRRSRGLELWEEAGRVLGVTPYAQGGLVGSGMSLLDGGNQGLGAGLSVLSAGSQPLGSRVDVRSEGVTVSLGQVNFNVKLSDCKDPEEVLTLLKEKISECTEEIALSLATSLERSFENMPLYPC